MLVSIGIEIETRWMSLVKLYPGKRVYNPKNMYRVRLGEHLDIYPDRFDDERPIHLFVDAMKGRDFELGESYFIPGDALHTVFTDAEFVATYPDPIPIKDISQVWEWTLAHVKRSVLDIQQSMNDWRLVEDLGQRADAENTFYFHGDFLVNTKKKLGLLCRKPGLWRNLSSTANFTFQCTYGIPITAAYTFWTGLQRLFQGCRQTPGTDLVQGAWNWVMHISKWETDSIEGNVLFLFYYSFLTRESRKKNAVFVIRHPMVNLWRMALTDRQKSVLFHQVEISGDRQFMEYVESVLDASDESTKRATQYLVDVGLVPFDRMRKRFFFEYRALTTILRFLVHGREKTRLITLDHVLAL